MFCPSLSHGLHTSFADGDRLFPPVDFLPDVLPVLGQVDDLGLIVIASAVFLRLCPRDAVTHHRAAIAERRRYAPMAPTDTIIDAEWGAG